tara:strand:+ start:1150 stop:1437 length:288 start_codon:yes stop_codon:yes gene_type:complete
MKVKELIERVGAETLPTGRAIAYIIDGLEEINMLAETHISSEKFDITENQRFYKFPMEALKILDVRVKNHLNSKDEYRSIPRLVYKPLIKDEDNV